MYPVVYWCEIFNGYANEYEGKVEHVSGCTFAKNYADAMKNIEAYYGDSIINVKMEMIEENTVLEFKTYEEAKHIVTDM